jgi:hypothetical protein
MFGKLFATIGDKLIKREVRKIRIRKKRRGRRSAEAVKGRIEVNIVVRGVIHIVLFIK